MNWSGITGLPSLWLLLFGVFATGVAMRQLHGKWDKDGAAGIERRLRTSRKRLAVQLIGLSSGWKAALTMGADTFVLGLAAVLAVVLSGGAAESAASALITLAPAVTVPLLLVAGGYQVVVRFIGAEFALRLGVAIVLTALAMSGLFAALGHWLLAWNVVVLYAIIGFGGVLLLRLVVRRLLQPEQSAGRSPVLIYGAGEAGRQLAAALSAGGVFRPVAFLDDHHQLQGRRVQGLKVHSAKILPSLRDRLRFDSILLAMPSLPQKRRRQILENLSKLSVKVMTMPRLDDLASGRKQVDELREVQIEDLLGRNPVTPNESLLDAPIRDRVVMITGAGGSIGSELSRLAVHRGAQRVVLFDNSEYALYTIERELSTARDRGACEIVPVLGSVTDARLLRRVIRQHGVETLYHAAAYKHVPLVEQNIAVALHNNVIGTRVTAETAMECGVREFVLVSTDKAVRPTSVMGASKRVCELIVQALAEHHPKARLAIVRFGNVLGSSGSVVPLFQQQIRGGGPVTVTHPEVTRYFMTISEAAQLVVQAGAMGHHGEVFVLDMGEPVLIRELAARMIQLAGLRVRSKDSPNGDIEIQYTGLRPGEKLYEELLIGDKPEGTSHPRIYHARDAFIPLAQLRTALDAMAQAVEREDSQWLLTELRRLVAGFKPGAIEAELPKLAAPLAGGIDVPLAAKSLPAEATLAAGHPVVH